MEGAGDEASPKAGFIRPEGLASSPAPSIPHRSIDIHDISRNIRIKV